MPTVMKKVSAGKKWQVTEQKQEVKDTEMHYGK